MIKEKLLRVEILRGNSNQNQNGKEGIKQNNFYTEIRR
jgi:hypothetical protein